MGFRAGPDVPGRGADRPDRPASASSDAAAARPVFARLYSSVLRPRQDAQRRTLLEGLSGTVAEIGAGAGITFSLYPPTVTHVIAVEPEPYLRRRAAKSARHAQVPVEVRAGTAEDLPLADASIDAVVVSLVLCSVRSQPAALGEIRRVLRPGGELRFYEHVAAQNALARGLQRAADATFWPRLFGGCHMGRDTVSAIASAGFDVEHHGRISRPSLSPPPPAVIGVATPSPDAR